MRILSLITIVFNILAIAALLLGMSGKIVDPKSKAASGYFVVGTMAAYLIFLAVYIILRGVYLPHIVTLTLILCLFSPFIVGRLVRYETLKKYTIIQILCYFVSFVILYTWG